MTLFVKLIAIPSDQKEQMLREAAHEGRGLALNVDPRLFSEIPGSPFAYWVKDRIRQVFKDKEPFEGEYRTVKQGLATANDFRFVRSWWEIDERKRSAPWFGFAKGGVFAPYYADVFLLLKWGTDGHELKAWAGSLYNESHWSRILKNVDFYFRPGLTWPIKNRFTFKPRALPGKCIFAHVGSAAFVAGDDTAELLALQGLMSSSIFTELIRVMAGWNFEVGVIQRTPVPTLNLQSRESLSLHSQRAWSLNRTLDTVNENSHAFLLPAPLRTRSGPYDPRAIETELAQLQGTIDGLAFDAYGLDGDDRGAGEEGSSADLASGTTEEDEAAGGADAGEEMDDGTPADNNTALYSWAVGVTFGRFDIRLATGERQAPPEPEPFDPLPARSPGMIPEPDEARVPTQPLLVDDPGHPLDLATRAGNVLERVGFAPENPETFRRWLARDFFPLHIKMYSKSRRKAPIYWQLATPSASYSVWLYIHAFSRDALYQVHEIAELKLLHEERKLRSQRADLGPNPTAAERKELAAHEAFVEELRAFLDEVKRVVPLWNPNLDDGVIINFAPLWRLVPHHKPWQKELKATWDALCDGEYDWAHLALHLWPERVVPKCATDRSLAIAHELEEIFWVEGEDGKWKPRPNPARPVEELVKERTSPAVKAALKSLLEAPAAPSSSGPRRPRRRRGNAGDEA